MNRVAPKMDSGAYKTYQILAPTKTHWRKATCAEVECQNHVNGWKIRVEILTPDLVHAAKNSGRRYTELSVAPGETYLVFEAGQSCFQERNHRIRLEREEIFRVRHGDWRKTYSAHTHANPWDWQDDFALHQDKLATEQQKG